MAAQTFAKAFIEFPEYSGSASFCGCNQAGNQCAHLVAKALDSAGFSIKIAHDSITARCANKLPIRAADIAAWIQAKTAATAHSSAPKGDKVAFFYTVRSSDGQGHCGFINGSGVVKDTGCGVSLGGAEITTYYYK